MHLTGEKKKILIALAVKKYARVNPFRAQYIGEVLAPARMQGKIVRVNLTHYNAWKLAEAKSANEMLRAVERFGYQSIHDFDEEVTAVFESMKTPGTIAMFQGCIESDEGLDLWGAWVGDPVGYLSPNDVISGYARLQVKSNNNNSQRIIADFLYPDKAKKITNYSEFVGFYRSHLRPEIDGYENNANCLFRIKSGASDKLVNFWTYCAREERSFIDSGGRERSFNIPGSLEKTWDDAVVQGLQSAGLCRVVAVALGGDFKLEKPEHVVLANDIAEGLKSGEISIDAIPGQRHRVIGDALRGLGSKGSRIMQTIAKCQIVGSKSEVGFYPMVAIVNKSIQASAKSVKDQYGTIVVNRLFHEDDEVAVNIDGIPVNV